MALAAILSLLAGGDLLIAAEAQAYLGGPRRAAPEWREEATPTLLARRRVRRKRRRAPPAKKKPTTAKPDTEEDAATSSESGEAPRAGGGATPSADSLRRGARVEFDGRLVQGQMAKSGAIYLFARKRAELRSMVKERANYRKEILRTVYPSTK